jgi:hypothetical protein
MGFVGWPATVDDDGTYTLGTRFSAAFWTALKASIEAAVFSTTNPTVDAADIIDEVVTARGSLATLAARMGVSLELDGTLKSLAGYPTVAEMQTIIPNVMPDSLTLLWPDGDAAAPYGWTLSGTGATIARAGSGLADTTQMKYGNFCVKITYGTAVAKLTRAIIAASPFTKAGGMAGKKVSFACYCKSSIANHASIIVDDGVTTTRGGQTGNGTYHSGDGTVKLIYCTHTMAAGASKLDVICDVAQSGAAYFGNFCLAKSDKPFIDWTQSRWGWYVVGMQQRGTLAVTTPPIFVSESRPTFPFPQGGLLYETKIKVKTAPAGAALIYDVNKGAVSCYSTRPQVADGATAGKAYSEGTYANRCFKEDDILGVDCDQVGSGTAGEEATIVMTFHVPMPDWNIFLV